MAPYNIAFFTIVFAFLLHWPTVVSAHFALAPKIEILPDNLESPDTVLMRTGNIKATRGEFSAYLQRITAFDTRYDRVQPAFYSHFNLVRGISLFHPDNVHSYIDKTTLVKQQPQFYELAVDGWFEKQAEVFAAILNHHQKSLDVGNADKNATHAVMNFYAASVKTEFLEELIVLGAMTPTLQGLADFVSGLSAEKRASISTGAEKDSELTPPEEQRRMRQRWISLRRDVLKNSETKNQCNAVDSMAVPKDTVLVTINEHKVTLADYQAIFGKPRNDTQWNASKRVNCSRVVLFYAMADLADQLAITPERVREKIAISTKLYLAAVHIADEVGPQIIKGKKPVNDLTFIQTLMAYPEVVELKDQVLERTRQKSGDGKPANYIDRNYLISVPWSLKRKLAPQHSIHL